MVNAKSANKEIDNSMGAYCKILFENVGDDIDSDNMFFYAEVEQKVDSKISEKATLKWKDGLDQNDLNGPENVVDISVKDRIKERFEALKNLIDEL